MSKKYPIYDKVELAELTTKWADERGILKNGKVTTQALKLMSEAGELSLHLFQGKEVTDDIGDMLVVLNNIIIMYDKASIPIHEIALTYIDIPLLHLLGELSDAIIKELDINDLVSMIVRKLNVIAEDHRIGLEECWSAAYDDIKDRKGYLNEHGNFIKESDPAYQALMDKLEPIVDNIKVESAADLFCFKLKIIITDHLGKVSEYFLQPTSELNDKEATWFKGKPVKNFIIFLKTKGELDEKCND